MREGQCLQDVVVLAVDDRVEGLVATALHLPSADESGIDRVEEFGHHHENFNECGREFGLLRFEQMQIGPTLARFTIAEARSRIVARRPATED